MSRELQKGTLVTQLMGRALSGQSLQGVPSVSELMRKAGVTSPSARALALAPPSVSIGEIYPLRKASSEGTKSTQATLELVERLRISAFQLASMHTGDDYINTRANLVALKHVEYIWAVKNNRSLRNSLQKKIDDYGYISVLVDDEPELYRFVKRIFDSNRHTPDFNGYLNYLSDVSSLYAACTKNTGIISLSEQVRQEHTYITGSAGCGKTELLKSLILHDIEKGNASIIIDPTGNLARAVAAWPEFAGEGKNRLAFFSPSLHDKLRPILNPLDGSHLTPEARGVVATQLTKVLPQVIGRGEWTQQTETLASNCFHVLLDMKGADFFFLWRALVDTDGKHGTPTAEAKRLHEWGLKHRLRAVQYFFEIDFFSGQYATTKGSLRAKIGSILQSETFADVTSGTSTFILEQEVEAGKTVIFDLKKWGDDNTAAGFGRMVIALVAAMAMRRDSGWAVSAKALRPVFVYVDEVSMFVGPAIIKILYRLRQNGIHLIMAQQTPGDGFDDDAKKQIFTNTAIKFAHGDNQREMLTAIGAPPESMQGLAKGEFIGRWGHGSEPFKVRIRRDRANFSNSMSKEQWGDLVANQLARYYRLPAESGPQPTGHAANQKRPPVHKQRPLRRI